MDANIEWADHIARSASESGQDTSTLFQSDWWLDAACGGAYDKVEVKWDGRVVGSLPFHLTRRAGLTRLRMPPYTRTLGPTLQPPPSKFYQRQANLRRIVRHLTGRLPRHDFFEQALDPHTECAHAFHLAGFECVQAYTFRIAPHEARDTLWAGLDKKLRNILRSAGTHTEVQGSLDLDRFLRLSYKEKRQVKSTQDTPTLRRLFEAAASRGQAVLRCAVGPGGDQTVAILIWDASTLYYWLTARSADPRASGSNALLVWDAIAVAQTQNLTFDFDSYSSRSAGIFLESFGRSPVVRPVVRRATALYSAAAWLGGKFSKELGGMCHPPQTPRRF